MYWVAIPDRPVTGPIGTSSAGAADCPLVAGAVGFAADGAIGAVIPSSCGGGEAVEVQGRGEEPRRERFVWKGICTGSGTRGGCLWSRMAVATDFDDGMAFGQWPCRSLRLKPDATIAATTCSIR